MIIPFGRYGIQYWLGLCISIRVSIPYGGSYCETGNFESDAVLIRIRDQEPSLPRGCTRGF